MEQPLFTPISIENDLFSDKENLDLADSKYKHSYFNRNDKTFHIKFPVPNENFELYFITNHTKVDSVRPIVTLWISDKTTDEARKKAKKHIAYITFKYDDIIPHPGIDFDLNSVKEIKIIIFNDDSVAHKKDQSVFVFKSKDKIDHFYKIDGSNIVQLSDFTIDKARATGINIVQLSDFKLDKTDGINIVRLFDDFKPDEVGGGVIVGSP